MEFSFESLEVYRKSLRMYGFLTRQGAPEARALGDLKRGIMELCQGIVTGASCWNREQASRHYLAALDMARCLAPLAEGAALEGVVTASDREQLRGELDGVCRMLVSLARKAREGAEQGKGAPPDAATKGGRKEDRDGATPG